MENQEKTKIIKKFLTSMKTLLWAENGQECNKEIGSQIRLFL